MNFDLFVPDRAVSLAGCILKVLHFLSRECAGAIFRHGDSCVECRFAIKCRIAIKQLKTFVLYSNQL